MFKKLRARINERRELEAKLEGLTDPTLIHRMYRTHLIEKITKQLPAASRAFNGFKG